MVPGEPPDVTARRPTDRGGEPVDSTAAASADDPVDVDDLVGDLRELAAGVDSPTVHEEIGEATALVRLAGARGLIDSGVRRLDLRDAAEALVGTVVFASPLLVEGGIFDIATHVFGTRVAGLPVFLLANVAFVVLMTYALVEWTGRDREDPHRLAGVLPTRVVMILAVSFLTTGALMAVWGRVGPWLTPTEALARVTVLWTVGALGAALGDIVSGDELADGTPVDPPGTPGNDPDQVDVVESLHGQFDDLHAVLDDEGDRQALRRIEARATRAAADDGFGDHIDKYTSRDVAEAFVGSVFFAIPLLVEDGVYEVADFLLSLSVAGLPVAVLAHATFVVVTVAAILYWTGPQDVEVTRPIFGVVPRRLLGIAVVAFLTAAALMTMWGRLDGWQDPAVALARISTVWAVASFGGALGDILPGESSGADINDQLADFGDRVADWDDDA
mgnify:CR=1 FL=1